MKYFTNITDEIKEELVNIQLNDNRYRPRLRAQSIILSYKGLKAKEIADLMDINLDRLYRWWRKFEQEGIIGLYDKEGKGRPKKFKKEDEEIIKEAIKKSA